MSKNHDNQNLNEEEKLEKHKEKYKAQKLDKTPSPKARGRPKKVQPVIISKDEINEYIETRNLNNILLEK